MVRKFLLLRITYTRKTLPSSLSIMPALKAKKWGVFFVEARIWTSTVFTYQYEGLKCINMVGWSAYLTILNRLAHRSG